MATSLGLAWLPIGAVTFFISGVLSSYIIAVSMDHIPATFPYISDSAAQSPERNVFSLLVTIGAICASATSYIRYVLVKSHFASSHLADSKNLPRVNFAALSIGSFASLGVIAASCFENTSVKSMHLLSTWSSVGGFILYSWTQVVLTGFSATAIYGQQPAGNATVQPAIGKPNPNGNIAWPFAFFPGLADTAAAIENAPQTNTGSGNTASGETANDTTAKNDIDPVRQYLNINISVKGDAPLNTKSMTAFRAALATTQTITALISMTSYGLYQTDNAANIVWYVTEAGYKAFVTGSATEWTAASLMVLFLLSFVPEFKRLHMDVTLVFDDVPELRGRATTGSNAPRCVNCVGGLAYNRQQSTGAEFKLVSSVAVMNDARRF